ncbi:MAG: hypothetical protein COA78_28875 [Blastopirellula sp.]|nr:MAG: hypothetical protein COA78_28875 [Blastopirellula sp.]
MAKLRVIKLGGSLFQLPDLATRLVQWIEQQAPLPCLVIAGGGMFTDAVRQLDQQRSLPTPISHDLAMRSMGSSARLIASGLGSKCELISEIEKYQRVLKSVAEKHCQSGIFVCDIYEYWHQHFIDQYGNELQLDWTLTSDSIAALLADFWEAEEFVLMKSCDCSSSHDYQSWADAGMVDPQFPEVAKRLQAIRWVNLARDA